MGETVIDDLQLPDFEVRAVLAGAELEPDTRSERRIVHLHVEAGVEVRTDHHLATGRALVARRHAQHPLKANALGGGVPHVRVLHAHSDTRRHAEPAEVREYEDFALHDLANLHEAQTRFDQHVLDARGDPVGCGAGQRHERLAAVPEYPLVVVTGDQHVRRERLLDTLRERSVGE